MTGPAGTLFAFRTDVLHRGSRMTGERSTRFALLADYDVWAPRWTGRVAWAERGDASRLVRDRRAGVSPGAVGVRLPRSGRPVLGRADLGRHPNALPPGRSDALPLRGPRTPRTPSASAGAGHSPPVQDGQMPGPDPTPAGLTEEQQQRRRRGDRRDDADDPVPRAGSGIVFERYEPDDVTLRLPFREDLTNDGTYYHGGVDRLGDRHRRRRGRLVEPRLRQGRASVAPCRCDPVRRRRASAPTCCATAAPCAGARSSPSPRSPPPTPTARWWPTRSRPTASCDEPDRRRPGAHGPTSPRAPDRTAPRDRRRRRPAARRGVRAVRHRPRAVHRPHPARPRRSSPATSPSASSRRRAPRPPSAGAWRPATAWRSRCSCRAGRADACAAGAVPALRTPRHRRHVRLHPRRPGRRACGAATPSTSTSPRLDAAAGARRARPRRRHAVQPARRRHPLGRRPSPRPQPGDVVAVLGPGVRGLSACAAAKEAGAGFVMVTGRRPARRRAARRSRRAFGADLAVDVAERRPGRAPARARPAALADVVVDVTAQGARRVRPGHRLARTGRHRRRGRHPRRSRRRPGSSPTTSSTRSCACSVRSASTSPPTGRAHAARQRPLPLRRPAPALRRPPGR